MKETLRNNTSILFLTASVSGGGAERRISTIAALSTRQGFDVHLLILYKTENQYDVSAIEKIQYFKNSYSDYQKTSLIQRVRFVRRCIRDNRIALVVSILPHISFLGVLAVPKGVKHVSCLATCPLYLSKKSLFFERIVEKKVDVLVLQCAAQMQYVKTKKTIVIPNPVGEEFFLKEKQYSPSILHFMAVGRLVDQKNFSLLIEAFSRFVEVMPDATLEIYGEGPLMQPLQDQIGSLNVGRSVFLRGRDLSIIDKYQSHDCFILSSKYEGFPNALLEAMACGLPVISTDCPTGPSEIILDHENGLLIRNGSISDMISALLLLSKNPDFARGIGEKARREVAMRFTGSKISEQYFQLFTNILQK